MSVIFYQKPLLTGWSSGREDLQIQGVIQAVTKSTNIWYLQPRWDPSGMVRQQPVNIYALSFSFEGRPEEEAYGDGRMTSKHIFSKNEMHDKYSKRNDPSHWRLNSSDLCMFCYKRFLFLTPRVWFFSDRSDIEGMYNTGGKLYYVWWPSHDVTLP